MFMDEGGNAVVYISSITYQCQGWLLHASIAIPARLVLHHGVMLVKVRLRDGLRGSKSRNKKVNEIVVFSTGISIY